MKPQTLKAIKAEIRKFLNIYEILSKYWNGEFHTYPHTTVICVLLQNMGFDGENTHDYDHYEAERKLYELRELLRQINIYHECYMTDYPFKQVDMIIEGHRLSEID